MNSGNIPDVPAITSYDQPLNIIEDYTNPECVAASEAARAESRVLNLAKRIFCSQADTKEVLTKTIRDFSLAAVGLSEEQRAKFTNLFAQVYARIEHAKALKDNDLATACLQAMTSLDKMGFSSNLVKLINFADLSESATSKFPTNYVLQVNECGVLDIVPLSDRPRQQDVSVKLKQILATLKDNNIAKHLSMHQLLEIKLAAMWLTLSYASCRASNLPLIIANYSDLNEISKKAGELFQQRSENGEQLAGIKESVIGGFLRLSTNIQSFEQLPGDAKSTYLPDFWADEGIITDLKSLQSNLQPILTYLKNPGALHISEDLQVVGEDSQAGLKLYKSKSKENEYLLFLDPRQESFAANYSAFQSGQGQQWGGVVHAPVCAEVMAKQDSFERILDNLEDAPTITIVGFGLSGAAAHLLAFDHAKTAKARADWKYKICCIGTPACFDQDASDSVERDGRNIKSVNFKYVNDALAASNYWLPEYLMSFVRNEYAETHCNLGIYQLFEPNAGIVTKVAERGHSAPIYVDRTGQALELAFMLHELNKEAIEFNDAIQAVIEKK